tara:strand:- start:2254 stop:2526 length:273 start_codon:yes stop_codon:yes gene_type:complete
MYSFKAIKSEQSTAEEFASAINCAITCIESVLDNDAIKVTSSGNTISISSVDPEQQIEITASDCKEKIKGCFCNGSGQLYPEFSKIEPQQ